MAGTRPKGFRLLAAALGSRKSAAMLALGFTSGLPFALLIGTLNAWLGDAKVDLATIGVLSWISLASAFKFLWSPLVDRLRLPVLARLGRRKSWILLAQVVLVLAFAGLASTDPATDIGRFALYAVFGALGWATQDIAIDAWRIDVSDEETTIELLSAIYQFAYRIASIVGGAFALFLAARMSWPTVYLVMAGLLAAAGLCALLIAPDRVRARGEADADAAAWRTGGHGARTRAIAVAVVGVSWLWAIVTIGRFMATMLGTADPGAPKPSATAFMQTTGPWIVAATVLMPLAVAAVLNRMAARRRSAPSPQTAPHGRARAAADHLYAALVAPLTELTGRLGWGVLGVIGLILFYPLCYNIWASFAYPFYLDYMHYSKDEVAFASKMFGIAMTMLGISVGALLFARIGRFPTVLLGAALPIFGNFLYADLADGAPHIDAFAHLFRLDALGMALGTDERMVRLLITICVENISTGIAGAAFVAYASSIVSKSHAAVQYALLSSLTLLIGSLAKGVAGEAFDKYGYAPVFRETALIGLIAIAFVLFEWWRSRRSPLPAEPGHTGEPA